MTLAVATVVGLFILIAVVVLVAAMLVAWLLDIPRKHRP